MAEYLLADVLDRQSDQVRRLLLRTSILDRVNGELAALLTGDSGGERILQDLARANAFVVSLEPARSWFRYHQLFADLLQMELRRTAPDLARPGSAAPTRPRPLPDPLSGTEMRVLRYVPTNLTAPEIASELHVSRNTVKTHVRNLYAKLGTHRRVDTVAAPASWDCSPLPRQPHNLSVGQPASRSLTNSRPRWRAVRRCRPRPAGRTNRVPVTPRLPTATSTSAPGPSPWPRQTGLYRRRPHHRPRRPLP